MTPSQNTNHPAPVHDDRMPAYARSPNFGYSGMTTSWSTGSGQYREQMASTLETYAPGSTQMPTRFRSPEQTHRYRDKIRVVGASC